VGSFTQRRLQHAPCLVYLFAAQDATGACAKQPQSAPQFIAGRPEAVVEAVFGVEYAGLSLGEGEVGAAFLVGGQFVLERGVQDVETSAATLQGGEGGVVEVVEGEIFGEAAYRRDSAHSKNSSGVEDMEPVRGDAGCAVGDGSGRAERGRMDGRTHDAAVCQPGDQGDNFLLMHETLNLRGDFGEVVAGEGGVLVEQQEPGNALPLGGLQGEVVAGGEAGIGRGWRCRGRYVPLGAVEAGDCCRRASDRSQRRLADRLP
jgi:hypothetical protein